MKRGAGIDSIERGTLKRRLIAVAAATGVWLAATAAFIAFGGALAGSPGAAAAAQYKPPPPPTTVLSGLSQPADIAADSRGNLWFVQGGAPGSTATLYVFAKGATTPVSVHTASGGDGSATPYIYDLGFDAADNPYFVQWTSSGTTLQSSLRRLDPSTGSTTVVASESGVFSGNAFTLTSGSAIGEEEIGADGTVFWTVQAVGATGNQEARIFSLAPGAATPTQIALLATPGLDDTIGDFVVATDGTIYFQQATSPSGGGPGGSIGIYRLAPGGSPQPIRVFPNGGPGDSPRPRHVGLDGRGNLIVGERIVNGFVRQGCAESTTYELVRYDAASLATPNPSGTVYSSATYPEFNFTFVGSSSYFRVSPDGDAFVNLLEASFGCSTPPGPFAFTHIRMIGADPSGTQHVFYDDAPSPPAPNGFYSFAISGNDLFATSFRLGTLWQFPLNKVGAKKPK